MTTKPVDRDRLQLCIWKVEKLLEEIKDIEAKISSLSEIKATTYLMGPKARDAKHSTVEEMAVKNDQLQEEKRIKIFELQLARFELSNELDRLYSHLWPRTIQMVKDYYIAGMDPANMKKKYGLNFIEKIRRVTG